MENEYIYDGQFHGNILVVGRTGYGKTTFGDEITDVFWVSKIVLSNEREDSMRDSFANQEVHFS